MGTFQRIENINIQRTRVNKIFTPATFRNSFQCILHWKEVAVDCTFAKILPSCDYMMVLTELQP